MKLLPEVFTVEKIGFQNVVSKRINFHYSEMEQYYKAFVREIISEGYSLKGPYFYSINNVPTDEMLDIEMFFPIIEDIFKIEGYQYSSYFEINKLIKTIIIGEFDVKTGQAYAKLLTTLEENNLNVETPFYHIFSKDGSEYINLYLGYYKDSSY